MTFALSAAPAPPSARNWLGTDDQGRDMLSGIIYGLRISLTVGAGSALIACLIGASLGLLAAYAGGRTDSVIMRLVDLQLSFPTILAALTILAFLGKGIMNVVIALVLALKRLEFSYDISLLQHESLRHLFAKIKSLSLPVAVHSLIMLPKSLQNMKCLRTRRFCS